MSIRKFYGSKEDSEQATRTLCEAFKDDPLMEATFGKEIWKEDAAMIFSWALWIYKCEDMIDLIVENEGSKNSYVVAAAICLGNDTELQRRTCKLQGEACRPSMCRV